MKPNHTPSGRIPEPGEHPEPPPAAVGTGETNGWVGTNAPSNEVVVVDSGSPDVVVVDVEVVVDGWIVVVEAWGGPLVVLEPVSPTDEQDTTTRSAPHTAARTDRCLTGGSFPPYIIHLQAASRQPTGQKVSAHALVTNGPPLADDLLWRGGFRCSPSVGAPRRQRIQCPVVTEIRFITEDEVPAFLRAVPFGFGDDLKEDDGTDQRFRETFPLETCIAAFEGDRIVATFGSFDFDVTVPGGTVPMAGTTIVTVQPTHRRRGVLTTMMRMHLDQAVDRGQPLAGLWASEAPIYGRFGYGLAAHSHDLTVASDRVALPQGPDTDTVRIVDPAEAPELLPPIYDRVRIATPGMLSRSEPWWRHRRFHDPEHWRDGASSRRTAVAYRAGLPVGYVTYRQKEKFEDWLPKGTVEVIEVVPVDDDARRTLWHYLASIDLFPNVHQWNAPADNPLYVEVDNLRRVTTRHQDTLYLRILDVPAALSARRYESDGTLTIGVVDAFMDRGGTFRLDVTDGVGSCTPTSDDADATMAVSELSSLLLGRPQAYTLWRAGLIEGDEASILTLDRLMRTTRLPYCPEVF